MLACKRFVLRNLIDIYENIFSAFQVPIIKVDEIIMKKTTHLPIYEKRNIDSRNFN